MKKKKQDMNVLKSTKNPNTLLKIQCDSFFFFNQMLQFKFCEVLHETLTA